MSLRSIILHPHPTLKAVAREVTKFDTRLHKLIDDMLETMYEAPGVGLAAPQVAISKRIFVVDIGDGPIEVINPKMVEHSKVQVLGQEGCLSIKNLYGEVKRYDYIKLSAQDRFGDKLEIEAKDYLARAMQHELDHLNGILFIDIADNVYEPNDPSKREEGSNG